MLTLTASGLVLFVAAYATAVASPGPGVAATVARTLGRGLGGAAGWVAGFVIGDLLWFWAAALGLAAMVKAYPGVLDLVRYAGAAYLMYIAWSLWTAPVLATTVSPITTVEPFWQPLLASLALTLGNAKIIVFFMAVLPSVVDLTVLTALDIAVLSSLIVLVMTVVMGVYTIAGARARRLLQTPAAIRTVNRLSGGVVAGAAVAIARN